MRVLHVNKFLYRRGGAEAYMLDLAEAQAARGDEVAFFAMRHPQNQPSRFDRHFPAEVAFTSGGPVGRAAGAGRMLWSTSAQRGMAAVVDAFRPDVAHLHNVYHQLSPSVLRPLARAGVPAVLTMHDYKLVCPSYQLLDHGQPCEACIGGSLREPVRRRCKDGSLAASAAVAVETAFHRAIGAYDPVDVLVSPSTYLAAKMVAGGVDPSRIEVCRLFSSVDPGGPAPATLEPHHVVFIGRIEPEKGLDVLIRALGAVRELHLSVAGEGSATVAARELAAELAPSRVRFLGRLDAGGVCRLLASAQTLALPSRWPENQPLTLLEAMASGTPVVASAIGGIPELVGDGRTGLLVPPGDWEAVAGALRRIDGDADLARALSAGARQQAAAFTLDRHLDHLRKIYQMAAEHRRSSERRAPVFAPPARRRRRTSS